MKVNVNLEVTGKYQNRDCLFTIEAVVDVSEARYGDDIDGNRGIDTYESDFESAVVYIDFLDVEEAQHIRTDDSALPEDIIQKIYEKAEDTYRNTFI